MKRVFISTRLSKLLGICPEVIDVFEPGFTSNSIYYWDQNDQKAKPFVVGSNCVEKANPSLFLIADDYNGNLPQALFGTEPSPDDYYLEHYSVEQQKIREQFIPLNCKRASHESGSAYESVIEVLLDQTCTDKTTAIIEKIWPSVRMNLEADKLKAWDFLDQCMKQAVDTKHRKEYADAIAKQATDFCKAYFPSKE